MNNMAVADLRHRITVAEYHRMGDAGVFDPNARIELINGELIETLVTMKPPHAALVDWFDSVLKAAIGDRARVRCRLPITLGAHSEPEPDIAIVRGAAADYLLRHPEPYDVIAVVEVSDRSRAFDLGHKVPLYGAFGISETWIVDVAEARVHVFRGPCGDGYAVAESFSFENRLSFAAFPDVQLRIADRAD